MASIFFIDDDIASELIVENLRHRGHNVERVPSVDTALRKVKQIAQGDLVVLDLVMPGLTGASFDAASDGMRSSGMVIFQELRRLRKDLPIIVFTANQDPALADVIAADRFARYISRWSSPKFQEFIGIVHEMLGIEPAPREQRPFIVHGHDDKTKLEVKNYLQNVLRLPEPVILHEQPNLGKTLIEKFEEFASVTNLAFVILTPDDHPTGPDANDVSKRRARQNVIFELGFFLGVLGRCSGRVFLLYKGPLELPSDLSGVVYLDITRGVDTAGEQIRRELEAVRD
jgi:CheY-like chemotaxis protein